MNEIFQPMYCCSIASWLAICMERKKMKKFLLLIAGALLAGTILTAANNSIKADAIAPEHQEWLKAAAAVLKEELAEDPIMAVVYMADKYPLYNMPGMQGEQVTELNSGATVYVQDVALADSTEYQVGFDVWYKVSAYQGGQEYEGFVNRAHLAISDEDFLQWEIDYGTNPAAYEMMLLTGEGQAVDYSDVEQFPESYQPLLKALKAQNPKWIFVPQKTELDWNYVIEEQLKAERSLIQISRGAHMYDGVHSPGWGFASKEALEYYMDPRNGLTAERIFQFEQLTYNASYHTEDALKIFLDNTFMGNGALMPGTVLTYAHGIWAIGAEAKQNVSPFHLAARIYQEQGKGTSPLISGTYPGFEGYYNFFNVGAYGTTNEEIYVNGLTYAKNKNWYNGYYSILGGAEVLVQNYISKGQDTLYLQKYNVIGSHHALFTHQYMQNIMAPTSEGTNTYKLYKDSGALDNSFVFKIPVYNNMPKAPCAYPETATRVAVEIPEGYAEAVIHVDGVAYPAQKRNGQYIAEIGHANGKTAVLYSYDGSGVPTGMSVWMLNYKDKYYEATKAEEFTDVLSYHGFSIRITGKSGIRFKAGIDQTVRDNFLAGSYNGYTLSDYGSIVMYEYNRDTYPFIKGGEKVVQGMAYGTKEDGSRVDNVYAVADGRTQFTMVFVGLPASEYKSTFAFRTYLTVQKDGVERTIYGPVRSRNIYELAQQAIAAGFYQEGSSQQEFLKQLIADGDAATQTIK